MGLTGVTGDASDPARAAGVAHWVAETSGPIDRRAIGTVVTDVAAADPDRVALLAPHGPGLRSWTWSEVHAESVACALRLREIAEPGQVVAIFAANSADWIFFEYGAALAGITFTAVNTGLADAEVAHVLRASKAVAVFADVEHRGSPLLERARTIAAETPVHDLAAWRSLPPATAPLPTVSCDDSFLIQFTSGTTGTPKGAVLSHRAAFNCARYQAVRIGSTADDNWLNVMPMHHVGGSVSVLLSMLAVGGTTTIAPGFEPAAVLRLMQQSRATITGLVPTMQLALLDHRDLATTDVSALRLVISGGSVVPTALIRRFESTFDAIVVNAYGQSESPSAIMTCPDDDDVTKAETIGRPLDQRDVRIARADGRTASFDEVGELLMRSPMSMDGYLADLHPTTADRDAQDREVPDRDRTIDRDGWLHTGDLCTMDRQGVIRIHGRVRDVIIRGGENIYPAEIEGVMLRHPAIADIAVVGVPDTHWGEVPVACYRPSPGAVPTDEELIEFARASLAGFKVPRRWVVVDAFPLTAAGKVKKYVLQQQLGFSA